MNAPTRHLTRYMVAGIVALLPMGVVLRTIVWLESTIAASWSKDVASAAKSQETA